MQKSSAIVSRLRRCSGGAAILALALPLLSSLDARPLAAQGYAESVAAGDGEVFVGESLNSRRPGIVYVYRKGSDGSWEEAARLTASDAEDGDHFGRAIAVQGNTLWVGATVKDSSVGAAYLFERGEGGEWSVVGRFQPEDLEPEEAFGRAAAIDGPFALVASWGHDEGKGAVYVYRRDPESGEWSQYDKLTAEDAAPNDWFGQGMAIEGDLAVIAAPRHSARTGAAYVFRHDPETGSWERTGELEASGLERNARFGSSIALADGRIVVGAPGHDRFSGAAHLFEWNEEEESWEETARLLPFDGAQGTQFGATAAWVDDELWVGAPGADRAGRIYRFRRSAGEGQWGSVAKLAPAGVDRGDSFASTLAYGARVAVAGLTGDDHGAGTAIILEPGQGDRWASAGKVWSELENYARVRGGTVECGGDGRAAAFGCRGVDLVSFVPISEVGGSRGVRMNDVWGWTDPETGREYALAGRMDGTAFVDVTDPENPVYLGSLPMTEGARANAWRDIKTYRNHAYIVADGAGDHGMQVFDLTRLRDVSASEAPVTFDADTLYDRVNSVHNIVINTETGFAYAVGAGSGGETCGGGLHMIDIRDPKQPTFAGCFADTRTGRQGTGYTHDAQCVVYRGPDEEHRDKEICVGANETALSVADVSDKENPEAISMATYPNAGYTHQGWFGPEQRYFYLNDELDELQGKVERTRTMVWDMADLDDPIMVKEFYGPTASSDHNLYVIGDRVFQSNYMTGFRVLDISDPENPVEVGWLDTVPYGEDEPGFGGSWSNYPFFESGNVLVTSGQEGLFVVRPTGDVAVSAEALEKAASGSTGEAAAGDGASN